MGIIPNRNCEKAIYRHVNKEVKNMWLHALVTVENIYLCIIRGGGEGGQGGPAPVK